jgi:hypothetical protein
MTFPKGRSGNPAGRKKGSKNLVTRALASVSEADAEAIIRKGLELAREGNPTLLRWCLPHIAPVQTSRPTHFNAPPIQDIPDVDPALAAVNAAFFSAEITPEERKAAEKVLQITRDILERRALRAEVAQLEQRVNRRRRQVFRELAPHEQYNVRDRPDNSGDPPG